MNSNLQEDMVDVSRCLWSRADYVCLAKKIGALLSFFSFFKEREQECKQGEGPRGRERETLRQDPCSVRSPMWGSILWLWDPEPKSRVTCLTDRTTQAPKKGTFLSLERDIKQTVVTFPILCSLMSWSYVAISHFMFSYRSLYTRLPQDSRCPLWTVS